MERENGKVNWEGQKNEAEEMINDHSEIPHALSLSLSRIWERDEQTTKAGMHVSC